MSVPATKALPPAPRSTATRTPPFPLIAAQAAARPSYIAQVIALRAHGRSNSTCATSPATRSVTRPSPDEASEVSLCITIGPRPDHGTSQNIDRTPCARPLPTRKARHLLSLLGHQS